MAIKQKIRIKEGFETIELTPMKAIRKNCLECCGWMYSEVAKCEIETCCFYQYRMGKKPDQAGKRSKKDTTCETHEPATL